MNKRRLCLAVVCFIFTAICSVALILAKSDVKAQKAIVATDTAGKIYKLIEYGVVYAPDREGHWGQVSTACCPIRVKKSIFIILA